MRATFSTREKKIQKMEMHCVKGKEINFVIKSR